VRPYRSVNPATGEEYGQFAILEDVEVDTAIARADSSYRDWSRRPVAERAAALARAAEAFRADKEALGRVVSE
jgi:succinate-semialdehyde dehydrogenase/glutarate-semialdehyde dehydrogenase